MDFDKVQRRAIRHYGPEVSLLKVAEELAELAAAIIGYHIAVATKDEERITEKYEDVCEETADAEVVITKLRWVFPSKRIDEFKVEKTERLIRRMDKDDAA